MRRKKTDSLYERISRALLYDENPVVSIEELKKLMCYEEKGIQSIKDYLIQIYSRNRGKEIIVPGRTIRNERKFHLRAKDLIYRNEIISQKVVKEELDFAEMIVEELVAQKVQTIHLKEFIHQCYGKKLEYYHSINQENQEK
jgi:hypothetical protein